MTPFFTHLPAQAWQQARKMWRLVVLSTALASGWFQAQAQTPTVPTPAQAASTAALPVLGTLILSPLERRQLDAVDRWAATGQVGPLPSAGGASRTAMQPEAPMFWINRRPPSDAGAGNALRILSGKLGNSNPDPKNVMPGAKPLQEPGSAVATLPPGAITINRATPRTGTGNSSRMPVN